MNIELKLNSPEDMFPDPEERKEYFSWKPDVSIDREEGPWGWMINWMGWCLTFRRIVR